MEYPTFYKQHLVMNLLPHVHEVLPIANRLSKYRFSTENIWFPLNGLKRMQARQTPNSEIALIHHLTAE